MQTFVVIAAKRGRPIPEPAYQRLRRDEPYLPFPVAHSTQWCNETRTVMVRAWCEPNEAFGLSQSWSDRPDGFTAYSGYVWERGHGPNGVDPAEQLAARARRLPVDQLVESLAGVFTAVSVDADGRGVCVSDPLGIGMLYTGEHHDYTVVSSRPDVAAWAATETPSRDPLGAAWLPYAGHIVGTRTGFAGISALPTGHFVAIDPQRGAQTRVWSPEPWREPANDLTPAEHVERVRHDIAADLRVVLGLPAERKIAGLTGGRDTRLILAVMLSEGLTDGVTFRTLGNESVPDVQVARTIAAHFHLDHEAGSSAAFQAAIANANAAKLGATYEERIRRHVTDTTGMLNIWDMGARLAPVSTLNVSGLCGEIMSTHFDQTSNVASFEEVERRFLQGWRFGDVGLLRDDVYAELQAQARAELFDEPLPGATPIECIDIFFLRNRLRRWTGTAQEIDQTNRVFPLYTLNGVRSAFSLGDRLRRAMYLHASIIQASCPELVSFPFAGPGWPDPGALAPPPRPRGSWRRWVRARVPRRAAPSAAPARPKPQPQQLQKSTTANQAYQARVLENTKRLLTACLVDDPANDVFDIIDRQRTLHALENLEHLDLQRRIRLYGAATAALWLGDRSPVASSAS